MEQVAAAFLVSAKELLGETYSGYAPGRDAGGAYTGGHGCRNQSEET